MIEFNVVAGMYSKEIIEIIMIFERISPLSHHRVSMLIFSDLLMSFIHLHHRDHWILYVLIFFNFITFYLACGWLLLRSIMTITEFYIRFDQPVFYPGQMITGQVVVALDKPKEVRGNFMQFFCYLSSPLTPSFMTAF